MAECQFKTICPIPGVQDTLPYETSPTSTPLPMHFHCLCCGSVRKILDKFYTWATQTLMMWSMSLADMSSGPHCQPTRGGYCLSFRIFFLQNLFSSWHSRTSAGQGRPRFDQCLGLEWTTSPCIVNSVIGEVYEKQDLELCFESHLSVGRGKGWSGEGCWFGAGIIFVGFIWTGEMSSNGKEDTNHLKQHAGDP